MSPPLTKEDPEQEVIPAGPPYTKDELKLVAEMYLDFTAPLPLEGVQKINPQLLLMNKMKGEALKKLPKALSGMQELSTWPQIRGMTIEAFILALQKVVELDNGGEMLDDTAGCQGN